MSRALAVALGQYFGVAGYSQHIGQLAQLVEEAVRESERIRRRLQQAADLAGGHPHLVHGVVGVGAHGAIPHQQLVELLGHRPM